MSWGLRPVRGFPPFQHENAFCQVSLRAGVARLLARFREVTVTIVTALKIAQALGVTLADLFSELERRRGRSK